MLPFPELDFRRTPVTLILAAVAVALEVVCSLDEPRRLHYYNAAFGILPSIWSGQLWRPFTTALMHGSLVHAAFNVLVFVTFGPPLESRFGSFRFLGLVVLLGYLSMLPQFLVSTYDGGPLPMIVGLSGILYGLFGILLVGRRWHLDLAMVCDASTVKFLIVWFFLCILLSYTGLLPVANTAHGRRVAVRRPVRLGDLRPAASHPVARPGRRLAPPGPRHPDRLPRPPLLRPRQEDEPASPVPPTVRETRLRNDKC